METLLPGARLGVLGGGQLGRMFALAARRMGYAVGVYTDQAGSPATQVAERVVVGSYEDVDAIAAFAAGVDALTLEFENFAAAAIAAAERVTRVRPGHLALHVTQHRSREKEFLSLRGLPVVPYVAVTSGAELEAAVARFDGGCLVKTAGFGYDGKGQVALGRVPDAERSEAAAALVSAGPVVVERRIELAAELSVVAARAADGGFVPYLPLINRHVDQVLDVSSFPWGPRATAAGEGPRLGGLDDPTGGLLTPALLAAAVEATEAIFSGLEFVGLGCVEFFVAADGGLYVNEVAPRPHNSGHLTIEACATGQFEQQVRALCGLPLGSPAPLAPAAMANLLGDLWGGGEPAWAAALREPGVRLHLYGKAAARPGRKMGHLTAVAPDGATALARVQRARSALAK
jgi:5-(carboxyamino)imidazole ribonucleotide synthase